MRGHHVLRWVVVVAAACGPPKPDDPGAGADGGASADTDAGDTDAREPDAATAPPDPGDVRVERMSVSDGEAQADWFSQWADVTPDGRLVMFSSHAGNLVDGDENGVADVFVRDREAGTTVRVNLTSDGAESRVGHPTFKGAAMFAGISADGRYVMFAAYATDLVPGVVDDNHAIDVFVRDTVTGAVERVSIGDDGAQADADCLWPTLSPSGRYVAFYSSALSLAPGKEIARRDIYVRDREAGTTRRITTAHDGEFSNAHSSGFSFFSGDDRYVAFASSATNLLADGGGGGVFLYDLETDAVERVSVTVDGGPAVFPDTIGGPAFWGAHVSGDGRHVAFASYASNLVDGDAAGHADVFVRDRELGVTTRISVAPGGAEGDRDSAIPRLSGDGRYVAFYSEASNLVVGDINALPDVFVHDRDTGQTALVSVAHDGGPANDAPGGAVRIAADGQYIVFSSTAWNLVADDTNDHDDIFLATNPLWPVVVP